MAKTIRMFSVLLFVATFVASVQAQEAREVQKSGAFDKDGRVSIDTYKGSIAVSTWDKPQIEIHARIEADGYDRYERESVQDTEVRIDLSSSSAHIKSDYDRVRHRDRGFFGIFGDDSGNLPFVHYTIKMPRTARLVIKDYKSKTTVTDLQSDFEIETYKGEVDAATLTGSVNLETYKGRARIEFAGLTGRSRVETYKGRIDLSLPRGKGFDLEADLGRHARFDSDFDVDRGGRRSRHGDYDVRSSVNGGGPVLRVKSDKGTIRLLEH